MREVAKAVGGSHHMREVAKAVGGSHHMREVAKAVGGSHRVRVHASSSFGARHPPAWSVAPGRDHRRLMDGTR
jgi:hypothetical protein